MLSKTLIFHLCFTHYDDFQCWVKKNQFLCRKCFVYYIWYYVYGSSICKNFEIYFYFVIWNNGPIAGSVRSYNWMEDWRIQYIYIASVFRTDTVGVSTFAPSFLIKTYRVRVSLWLHRRPRMPYGPWKSLLSRACPTCTGWTIILWWIWKLKWKSTGLWDNRFGHLSTWNETDKTVLKHAKIMLFFLISQ